MRQTLTLRSDRSVPIVENLKRREQGLPWNGFCCRRGDARRRVSLRRNAMRNETLSVHGGFVSDPTTKAVATPIYQTVAYAFDSADHGAALFNLEADGFRYSRIANPTTAVLERRVAELEGGAAALAVASGQAALHYSLVSLADHGGNIVSVPQLYGTTHTLLSHILPRQGIAVRFAETDQAAAIERLIDDDTRAVFCES